MGIIVELEELSFRQILKLAWSASRVLYGWGDFNAIIKRNEAMGGSLDWSTWKNDLEECISRAGLEDLRYGGFYFTWSNRRDEDPILRKLDRALGVGIFLGRVRCSIPLSGGFGPPSPSG